MASYPREDLVGKRFGMLEVLAFAGRPPGKGEAYWWCRCVCGNETNPAGSNLKSGKSQSCGCQIAVGLRKANIKHGKTGTIEYRLWAGMLTRCYNPNEAQYKYYGGRGIEVCDRWRGEGGFENFLADMGSRPAKGYEIERVRNEEGYHPKNCCWATKEDNANNKSSNIRVVLDGESMSLARACRRKGLKYRMVYSRMRRHGLTFEQAIGLSGRRHGRLVAQKKARG